MQGGNIVRTWTDLPPSLHTYFFREPLPGTLSDYLSIKEISKQKILCKLTRMKCCQEKADRKMLLTQKISATLNKI